MTTRTLLLCLCLQLPLLASPNGYIAKKYVSTFSKDELILPGKKGICFAMREPNDPKRSVWGLPVKWPDSIPKVKEFKVSWNYSWASDRKAAQPNNIEFLPMIYGCYGLEATEERLQRDVLPAIKSGKVKRLMGFNEPDKKNQSNVNVKTAIEYWPLLEKMGIPLCSPSPARMEPNINDGTSQGVKGKWLQDFFYEVDKRGLRVDYVGVHWYGGLDVDHFKAKMERLYNMYGQRPLIISEFAPANWSAKTREQNTRTPAAVLDFMKEVLPWLEKTEWIAGYAWFAFGINQPAGWNAALLDHDMKLTACGRYYQSVSPENPNGDLSIKPDPDKPPVDKNKGEVVSFTDEQIKKQGLNPRFMHKSSHDLVSKSWKALNKKNIKDMKDIWEAATAMYGKAAKKQQSKLKALPNENDASKYSTLNDLGLITFILGQTYHKKGEKELAKDTYEIVLANYSYAQAYERKGPWWWSISKGVKKKLAKL